ncbi:MAG: alpha/beta hydrolase [Verrucomicrobiaceae bacterium]|nr:alpha/beta hydrolase [Verrucomicrobiaceae bacterium]
MKLTLSILLLAGLSALAQAPAKKAEPANKAEAPAKKAPAKKVYPKNPPKTVADFKYGPHERNVFDFWQAKSDKPTPLLFFIHGGGWMGGDKAGIAVEPYLKEGISVVSINYRYVSQSQDEVPPVKGPLHDAALALQTVCSKAKEWNIDKTRIGASGGSAGACSSLWLAFHPDMADPNSSDPIARESTRLYCASVAGAQTTLDPQQMKEWTPNSKYGGHAFLSLTGKDRPTFDAFLAAREKILPWIAEYSPYALVTSDDPPVHLTFSGVPNLGKDEKDPTHTANFGVKLQEHCKANGVTCELYYPGVEGVAKNATEYLVKKLKE